MFKSKRRWAAALLAGALAFIPGAAPASELIQPEQIQADEVKYKTCTAEYTDFIRTYTSSASEYYPLVTAVRYEGTPATYAETLVQRGDEVKAGDPIMRVELDFDAVALAELELRCERAKQSFARERAARQADIQQAQAELAAAGDELTRQVLTLQLEKKRILLEQYIYQQQKALDDLAAQLEEQNQLRSRNVIVAPCDGVVSDLAYLSQGDRITDGNIVCNISSESVMLLYVQGLQLRYGMDVLVEMGPNKSRTSYAGRVVAASDCIPDSTSDVALVEIPEFRPGKKTSMANIKVTAERIRLRNVLTIDRKAAVLSSGKQVVAILGPDGAIHKRYITPGLSTLEDTWVLQGLHAGDVVIID